MTGLSTIHGRIRRRLLLTYRVDASVARAVVPAPFRPQLVEGSAVAGVCMIALTELRPGWFPPGVGLSTENAAHRFAVEWDDGDGVTRSGVYITERHSSELAPVLGGGRLFPGVHRRARFDVEEGGGRFRVQMRAADVRVAADVQVTDGWESSMFGSVEDASDFYRARAIGWSPRRGGRGVEAMELASTGWAVQAARVNDVSSSFFDGLPPGAAVLDSALVMRDIPVTWRSPDVTRPR